MPFAIMRAKKLSSMGSVAASLKHCFRERDTPNADDSRTPDNEHRAAQSTDQAMGQLRELLPEKRRKDAVLAVEYVMSASPDWWKTASTEQQAEFFKASQEWLEGKYGAGNVIVASIHRDETSPHLSAFVVPITSDGRLSAKDYIGDRRKMTSDQTTYAKGVAHLGLERGIEGSRARHTSIQQHYAAIQQAERALHVTIQPDDLAAQALRKGIFSTTWEEPEQVADRLTKAVRAAYAPMAAAASSSVYTVRREREATATALRQRNATQELHNAFEGLSAEQVSRVKQVAAELREQNRLKQLRERAEREAKRQQGKGQGR